MASYADRAAIKRKLNITWDDEMTDKRVDDVIETAGAALGRAIGLNISDAESMSRLERPDMAGLLANACFYEWSNALDEFWINYADEIQRARLETEMTAVSADAQV